MCAQKDETTYNSGNTDYFIRLIGIIVCIGAAVSIGLTVLHLIDMGVPLTDRAIFIALTIDAALVILPFYFIASGKTDHNNLIRFICILIAALMLFLNVFASSYLEATTDFLETQYTVRSRGVIEYNVVAQRKAGIELSQKTKIKAGIQSTDTCKTEAERETKKLAAASFEEYDSLSDLIHATEAKALDVAVVQRTMLDAYAEYFPDSYKNLDVIATFKAGTDRSQTNAANAKVDITKPFAIYVSAIDEWGPIADIAAGRSDANIIMLIDPERYKILLINTPRDYYVQLHGTVGYRDKLTHAGVYGIEMSQQTLEDIYGFEINYHALINFDTVVNLVETMGGIVVDNPAEFNLWGSTYAAGEIYLNGEMALLYSRARKGLSHGDFDRGENQQRVIMGIVDRITEPGVVVHYKNILKTLSGTFRSNIPPKVIAQLFSRQISMGGDWTIERMSADGRSDSRPTYSMGAQELSVIIPDDDSLEEIRAAIRDFMNPKD